MSKKNRKFIVAGVVILLVAVFLISRRTTFMVSDPCSSPTASQSCSPVVQYASIIDYSAGTQYCRDTIPASKGLYVNNVPQGATVDQASSYFFIQSTSAASSNKAILTVDPIGMDITGVTNALAVSSSIQNFASNPFGSSTEICSLSYHIVFTQPVSSSPTQPPPVTTVPYTPPSAGQPPASTPSSCPAIQRVYCSFFDDQLSGGHDMQGCPLQDRCVFNQTKLNIITVLVGFAVAGTVIWLWRKRKK